MFSFELWEVLVAAAIIVLAGRLLFGAALIAVLLYREKRHE